MAATSAADPPLSEGAGSMSGMPWTVYPGASVGWRNVGAHRGVAAVSAPPA